MLSLTVKEPLAKHLDIIKEQHRRDLKRGLGRVALPNALDRKYPNAEKNGDDSGYFLQPVILQIRLRENGAGTICTSPCCRRR
jgi:hypothetical protein